MNTSTNVLSNEDLALANKYQEKNEIEHILDRPDTEIGSIEIVDTYVYVCKENTIRSS